MWDAIKGPNTILQTIIDKGLLLPALSYSRWMPVEAKVTYRISEIFIDLEKIPDGRDFHYVDKTHTQEWEDAVYKMEYYLIGQGQIRRNNIKENMEDPSIPKGKGRTKFVHDLKTKDWYLLSISFIYCDESKDVHEDMHFSIISMPENQQPKELMALNPRNRDTQLWNLENKYSVRRRKTTSLSHIKLKKETINKTLSAISPWIKPQ